MVIRPLVAAEHSLYDDFVEQHPHSSLFQSRLWQKYQAEALHLQSCILTGWENEKIRTSALIFEYPLPLGKSYWYSPRGPLFSQNPGQNELLTLEIKKLMKQGIPEEGQAEETAEKPLSPIFFRFDPLVRRTEELRHYLPTTKAQPTVSHQPATTLLLNITGDETSILAQMKEKGRYNIRLAEKKGVVVRSGSIGELYPLIVETGKRDGFSVHAQHVYETMLRVFHKDALLLIATYEETVIAGGIFLFFGTTATYYYGASANQYRNLMAPYLVQWAAIREARRRGCLTYDFLGIADADVKNHPLMGVTDFKRKFGGDVVAYTGGYLIPRSYLWTYLYHLYKKVR